MNAHGDDLRSDQERMAAIQDEIDRQREAECSGPPWLLWCGIAIGIAGVAFGLITAMWG